MVTLRSTTFQMPEYSTEPDDHTPNNGGEIKKQGIYSLMFS